jgi:hypothetical protein
VQPTDGNRFRDLLRGMGRMYGQEPDGVVLDAYWVALRDWDFAEFQAAAAHLMAMAKFMPRPADFNELRRAAEPTSAEAWESALEFAKSLWHPLGYRNGTIGDRAIDLAVAALGGYPALAMADVEKLQWLEKRFAEVYETTSDVESVRAALPSVAQAHGDRLAGIFGSGRGGFRQITAGEKPEQRAPFPALPAPQPKPTITIAARDKIAKLLPLNLSDDEIAKVSGQPVELVREIRTGAAA